MNQANPQSGSSYSSTAMWLHWIIAFLVFATLPLGWYGAEHADPAGQKAIAIHKPLGIAILLLTLVRVWWRLRHKPPPLPGSVAAVLRGIAWTTHTLFYVLLLALPLTGWWMTSAAPDRHAFGFGPFEVPFLPVPQRAGPAHFIHVRLAWLMIALVGLHILAALKHATMDDENEVMPRMLPGMD